MNQYAALETFRHEVLLENYRQFLATCRTPETVAVHVEKLRPLLKAWNGISPEGWTRTLFVQWLTAKKAATRGFSPRSIQLTLTAANMFIEWANAEGISVPKFTTGIERPTVHRGRPKFLCIDDAKKVIAACKGSWSEVFMALAFYAGLRKGEIKGARWEDVDFVAGTIIVHGRKTHRDRTLPLSEPLAEVLRRHQQKSGPIIRESLITYGTYQMLKRAFKRAGVAWKSPHRARAGFLTELLARGVCDIVTARDLAGHGSVSTTNIYLASTPDRLRAAVASLAI